MIRGVILAALLSGSLFVCRAHSEDAQVPGLPGAASPSVPAIAAPAASGDDVLARAAANLEADHWREARRTLNENLKRIGKKPEAWILLGRTYLPKKKYSAAISKFRRAAKLAPERAEGYLWAGRAFEAWGRIDEALNEYQAAFHADPGCSDAKSAWQRLKGPEQNETN